MVMPIKIFPPKDPDSKLDYKMDWSDWLLGSDTVLESSWIGGTGLTIVSHTNSGTYTTVLLSGGTAGETYLLTNRVKTVNLLEDDRTIMVPCGQR